jgi:two-component system response regulator HydG
MKGSDKKERILIVDDAPDTLEVLQRNLSSRGYQVFTATGVAEALQVLEQTAVDLVVTDLKMPKVSGLDLVRHVQENLKDTEVMLITGYASIEGAVQAVKSGAEEYLSKPFTDDELLSAVQRVLEKLCLRRAGQKTLPAVPAGRYGFLGESEAMAKVWVAVAKAASTLATVLISGGSGIPEGLLESELFGHVKGAFTGATESRAGFFQTADGGTIFLDEISDTSLAMQAKLLRVLQEKEVYMVGARRPQKVDVRVLAATNKDLFTLVKKGTFREDLFFRLNVINISLPPLRERGDDILLLARHFATRFAKEAGKPVPQFSENALRVLKRYDWPGNVRELENVLQRLVVMTDGPHIEIPDLPPLMRFSAPRENGFDRPLAAMEAEYIRNVLAKVEGNKTRAAEILGIDRKTLREKLKIHDSKKE